MFANVVVQPEDLNEPDHQAQNAIVPHALEIIERYQI